MSNVWLCVPSARPLAQVNEWCAMWHAQGYHIALWRDMEPVEGADVCITGKYPGWAQASNHLVKMVLESDGNCDWVVCGGDDAWPDPNRKGPEIALECSKYFAQMHAGEPAAPGSPLTVESVWAAIRGLSLYSFGVMQPTGDNWSDTQGRIIERICGSPWIGRAFAERINQGQGPWWYEYFHNWADEELQHVAQKLGVLWQRRDVIHYHDHAMRHGGKWQAHQQYFSADYQRYKPLFEHRKKMGFPGSEPL